VPEREILHVFGRFPLVYDDSAAGIVQVFPDLVAAIAVLLDFPGAVSRMPTRTSTLRATAAKSARSVMEFDLAV
jgi:hypothetical protein